MKVLVFVQQERKVIETSIYDTLIVKWTFFVM
jgi:hypothetical protein